MTSRLKTIAALGTAVAGLAALAMTQASPASADPGPEDTYAAVGANTTQDVMNQFATDLTPGALDSWNAVNPLTGNAHDIISYTELKHGVNCVFTRPNGSTEGLNALRKSINTNTTAVQLTVPPQEDCIDIGRSAFGPGVNQKADGQLVYIPFALDGVTDATGPGALSQFNTDVDAFTRTDLVNLYANCVAVTKNGNTYNPGANGTIHLYIPQPGSSDLKFWSTELGFNPTSPPTCDHQTILAGPNTGQAVEEHDGTAVNSDPIGIMPFSIPQWIEQSNSATIPITDSRHGAILHNINGVFPCASGNIGVACPATDGVMNVAFPFTREVYSIVQYDRVVQTNDGNFDSFLASLLAGPGSTLCQDALTITHYGFALLSMPQTTDNCGSTANTLRAFDSTDPL